MDGGTPQSPYRLAFVRDTDLVSILKAPGPERLRSADRVNLHDLRSFQVNRQLATEVDICRRKFHDARGSEIAFQDEAVCLVRKANFELKLAWVPPRPGASAEGPSALPTFLNISGAAGGQARTVGDPNAPGHARRIEVQGDIPRIRGKCAVFSGVGIASNYYHWIGEQMPRLALLRRSGHLAKLDKIVMFVRAPQPFIEPSVRTLFPEFTGEIVQSTARTIALDYAIFFVPHSLAVRTANEDALPAPRRTAWGSALHFTDQFDKMADQIVPKDTPDTPVTVISRAGTERVWVNEAEVLESLAPFGARAIRAEEMAFPDQIAVMRRTKLVVAKHGAGLANILFCRPGTKVIELTSRSHAKRSWDFAKLAIARGLDYQAIVADLPADDPFQHVVEADAPIPYPAEAHVRTGPIANAALVEAARAVHQG